MKVRSIVAQGDALVPFLQPLLIPDRDVPIEIYVAQLKSALTYSPQFVRVFASLGDCFECKGSGKLEEVMIVKKDGKDVVKLIERICPSCRGNDSQEQIHGFMIAYASEGMGYVYISQTYVHPKAGDERLIELYMNKVKAWAESQGKRSIRSEIPRGIDSLISKYGFKTLSTIIELRLDETEVQDGISRRTIREQQSEIGIDIDEESTDAERSVGQLSVTGDGAESASEPAESDRSGSDTLRGTDSAESPATVSADSELARTSQPSADTGVTVAG